MSRSQPLQSPSEANVSLSEPGREPPLQPNFCVGLHLEKKNRPRLGRVGLDLGLIWVLCPADLGTNWAGFGQELGLNWFFSRLLGAAVGSFFVPRLVPD